MADVMEVDLTEALDQTEGGFWFSFEDSLKRKDDLDPYVMTEGDIAGTNYDCFQLFHSSSLRKGVESHPPPLATLPWCHHRGRLKNIIIYFLFHLHRFLKTHGS